MTRTKSEAAGVLRPNKLNRKERGREPLVAEQRTWRRARGGGEGWGKGGRGGAAAAAALAEKARPRAKEEEGRKRRRRLGQAGAGSGLRQCEARARSCFALCLLHGLLEGVAVESVEEKRAPAVLLLAPGAGDWDARRGVAAVVLSLSRSSLFSRLRGLLPGLLAPGALIPAPCGMS